MKTYFIKIFDSNNWANRKVLKSLSDQNINDDRILKLLSHIVLSEQIWMLRLKGEYYQNKDFWEILSLSGCEKTSNENNIEYTGYLNSLNEIEFSNTITYTNSKGVEHTNTIEDTLTHIAFHSAYHRGQIAREVRSLNKEPVLTDYIAFVRDRKR